MARQLDEQYVKTGKVKVIFKHRAALGPESVTSAEAALCADKQGKFWDYHDKLFENWKGENEGTFSTANLKRWAQELGLNMSTFNTCFDNHEQLQRVREEGQESQNRGVTGTPYFFINETRLSGAYPLANFQQAIEAELKK